MKPTTPLRPQQPEKVRLILVQCKLPLTRDFKNRRLLNTRKLLVSLVLVQLN